MEEQVKLEPGFDEKGRMVITDDVMDPLMSILTKSKFIATVGLIGNIFIIIMGVVLVIMKPDISAVGVGVMYLLMGGLGCYLTWMFRRGVKDTGASLVERDPSKLVSGLEDINVPVKVAYVLTIIYLVVLALLIVVGVIAGVVSAMRLS